ncbi:MAG: DUF2155 domain-containing protein [Nitrospirae bacterium]|nr:DUF2155 domain-containing protein [Nitrospirota bacterium]
MKRVRGTVVGFLAVAILIMGCQKKESPPPPPQAAPQAAPQPAMPADIPPISGAAPMVIPETLKGKWKAVKFLVEDKKSNQSQEYVVNLGEELAVPSSSLVVKAEAFLPDLKIEGTTFTTASGELKNPAVHVRILDNGREVFNGWLFQLFPAIHPFQHERYNITLRDSVAAS